jgi:D-serine deaminase-like pyridoxal phosphate-dependent protein
MSTATARPAESISAQAMAEIEDMRLDDRVKGIPGGVKALRLGDVGRQGWNLLREDLPLPAAVLKIGALDNNSRWMAQFLQATGAVIAPHGKTTMSPHLFQRQLADGAWAITIATIGQLQICRGFGLNRLFLANQLVGRQAITYVVGELAKDPAFEFYTLADSIEGVAMIAAAAKRAGLGRPVNLLLEGGLMGSRTGCRTREAALAVARAIKDHSPWVALRGVEGFEGLVQGPSMEDREKMVGGFLDFLIAIAADCRREKLFAQGPVILSAGGSAYYDLAAERLAAAGIADALVVIRSGCYLTQDSTLYRRFFERIQARSPLVANLAGGLMAALEVWTYVQSRPEPGRLILTAGRRDLSSDADLPVPLAWFRPGGGGPQPLAAGHKVVELNDQHAHVTVPTTSPLRMGDMVALGISHPCTTFDKWQIIFLVDDAYGVTGAIRTFF